MVMPCLKGALLFAIAVFVSTVAAEATPDIEAMAREIADANEAMVQQGSLQVVDSLNDAPKPSQIGRASPDGRRVYVFVSFSLGDAALRDILTAVKGRNDVSVVWRGIESNRTMAETLRHLAALGSTVGGQVSIALDPPAFTRFAIESVPAVVIVERGAAMIRVAGLATPDYAERALLAGQRGDLGTRGPTLPIKERDLVEVMRERVASLDFASIERKALDKFWQRQTFFGLPRAQTTHQRRIDPTVIVTAPIRDTAGKVLVPAGQTFNPLVLLPFSQRLVVFDPDNVKQVDFVKQQLQQFGSLQRVTVVATHVDRKRGFEQLKALQLAVGRPVSLLTADVKERFQLRASPSIVTADSQMFIVDEHAL